MKKLTASITFKLLLAAFTIVFFSCSEGDDSMNEQLTGQWNLVNVSCECSPSDLNYNEHVWTFDLIESRLSVENAIEKPLQILETGIYTFELTGSTIKIESIIYDYYFEGDKLLLADHPEVDGPLMEFVR